MIELINVCACLTLLALLLRVGAVAHRRRDKLAVIGFVLVLGMQVVDPVARWLPGVLWTTAVANVAIAALALWWRHELWALVRHKLGVDDRPRHEMRRSTDFGDLNDQAAREAFDQA